MNPTNSRWSLRATTSAGLARRVTVAAALATVVLGVSACSSSTSTGTTTTSPQTGSTPTTGGSGSTTPTTTATNTTKPGNSGASLSQFGSKLAAGQSATFVATYKVSGTSAGHSESGTFTIAHDGSSSLFAITESKGAFEEIGVSGKATFCAKQTGKWICFGGALSKTFGASLDPFINLYSAKAQAAVLKTEEAGAYDVTTSSKNIAGQSANCITYHSHTDNAQGTICVTSQGVMAEAFGSSTSGTWTLTLSSFSSNVPSNEFTLPAAVTSVP
jgi:hypothetical protein